MLAKLLACIRLMAEAKIISDVLGLTQDALRQSNDLKHHGGRDTVWVSAGISRN